MKIHTQIQITKNDISDFMFLLYFGRSKDYLLNCILCAYRDFNRTLHGFGKLHNRDFIYSLALNSIKDQLIGVKTKTSILTQLDFDSWHKELCFSLTKLYHENGFKNFHIGQAQKWINMTIKYIFLHQEKLCGYNDIFKFAHIPIDNIMIEKLDYRKFNCAWSRIDNYDEYMEFQKYVRTISDNLIPLEFEFRIFMSDKDH